MKLPKNSTLPDRLRWLRAKGKLSLQGFADRIGFDKSYVSRLESGARENPSIDFVAAVAKAFGVSQAWLLEGQDEPGIHAVVDEDAPLPDYLADKIEDLLCCVELLRILAVEIPPLKLLEILERLPQHERLTPPARIFWTVTFARALLANPGEKMPVWMEQILKSTRPKLNTNR